MRTSIPICPVCAGPSRVEHASQDLTLCRCSNCDHCFTDLASIPQLEQYAPEYFEEEHRNWFQHPNLALYAQLAQVILGHKADAAVLDIGCGNGNFLRYLANRSASLSLTGIDIAPNPPDPRITYLQGDFLTQNFPRKFDVPVTLAVIEHIADVAAFARRMSELCTPGGLVMTMTVDERSVIYGTARALRRLGYAVPLRRLYSKHHLNHFTANSLQHLLESQGLATVRVIRHNSPAAAVDIPKSSLPIATVMRTGVWIGFQIGQVTGKTMLQTLISHKGSE